MHGKHLGLGILFSHAQDNPTYRKPKLGARIDNGSGEFLEDIRAYPPATSPTKDAPDITGREININNTIASIEVPPWSPPSTSPHILVAGTIVNAVRIVV